MLWLALIGLAAFVVARARYTADLSAFLPRTPTAAQQLLVDQLREGIASQLIIVALEGADPPTRSRLSTDMTLRLRADANFSSISNGAPIGEDRDRALLFDNRYFLSDGVTPERFTVAGLSAAIQESLDLLASPAGLLVKPLLLQDPTGELVHIVERANGGARPRTVDGVWASRDAKRALLLAQTRAAGSDTDGQERAMKAVQDAFVAVLAQVPEPFRHDIRLKLSGPGVFAVNARATIKHEVVRLSILSAALIMAFLYAVYRSLPALVLGLLPVASGALAGVAAVALGFGVVHGITLGFGITLIGESVDYSIYLFIQSRRSTAAAADAAANRAQWVRSLWPTIRLGVLTSICGFASLLPSGFPGLAQLGLYSMAGLIAAALVTRFILPYWLPGNFAIRDVAPLGRAVATLLQRVSAPGALLGVLALLAGLVLYLHRDSLWNRELSALSPVSAVDQVLDGQLRADIGAPDVRYLVIVSGPDRESVLQDVESVTSRLDRLVDDGVIGGFESPVRYLPSLAVQRARRASLPEARQLRERLHQAVATLPLSAERLEPFLKDIEIARARPLLTRADLEGTSLAAGVDALLSQRGATMDGATAVAGGGFRCQRVCDRHRAGACRHFTGRCRPSRGSGHQARSGRALFDVYVRGHKAVSGRLCGHCRAVAVCAAITAARGPGCGAAGAGRPHGGCRSCHRRSPAEYIESYWNAADRGRGLELRALFRPPRDRSAGRCRGADAGLDPCRERHDDSGIRCACHIDSARLEYPRFDCCPRCAARPDVFGAARATAA